MMMRRWILAVVFASLAVTVARAATPRASMDDARDMAQRAAQLIRSEGEAAFARFEDDPMWRDRDLYVFVFDLEGTAVSHGDRPALIGRSLINLRDVDGRAFVEEFVSVEDEAWVDYKWINPVTNLVEEKVSFIVRVGEYVVGVGAYKE